MRRIGESRTTAFLTAGLIAAGGCSAGEGQQSQVLERSIAHPEQPNDISDTSAEQTRGWDGLLDQVRSHLHSTDIGGMGAVAIATYTELTRVGRIDLKDETALDIVIKLNDGVATDRHGPESCFVDVGSLAIIFGPVNYDGSEYVLVLVSGKNPEESSSQDIEPCQSGDLALIATARPAPSDA